MTGMGEPRMLCTIERIDRSSPPGVLSCTIRAWAPSLCARSIAVMSRRTVTGVIAESISMEATGCAARAGAAAERSVARASGMKSGPSRGQRIAALPVEVEVLRPVERAANPPLDLAPPVDQPFLDRPPEGAAVVVREPEVAVPGVGVRVEVHELEPLVPPRERAQDHQGHGVVAA